MGKLATSRRYNQVPLLRSSPGGFRGSMPCRTYPGAKVGIIFYSASTSVDFARIISPNKLDFNRLKGNKKSHFSPFDEDDYRISAVFRPLAVYQVTPVGRDEARDERRPFRKAERAFRIIDLLYPRFSLRVTVTIHRQWYAIVFCIFLFYFLPNPGTDFKSR